MDVVRQTWLYLLHHRGVLSRGQVSFLYRQCADSGDLTGKDLYHWIHQHSGLDSDPTFQRCYRELCDQIPYVSVRDVVRIEQTIEQSKYGLSIDTFATLDHNLFRHATAQSMRLLQFPCLPLLFLQAGTVRALRGLGLDIPQYHDSIDDLPDWQDRQQRILDILCHDTEDFDQAQAQRRALHNRELFAAWQRTLRHGQYLDKVLQSVCDD
jgi:hypothetical protein